MADQSVFDLSYLSDAADGDLQFIQEVLEEYLSGTVTLLAEVSRAARVGDLDALRRAAHSVRGASASVGAMRVTATAGMLEDKARARDLTGAQTLASALDADFRALQKALADGPAKVVAS